MQMTKELEKRLKLMQHFNQVLGDKRSMYIKKKIYNDKIFVHNDIMYATDANIFVAAANLTDQKDFSFFKCSDKKFEYMDSGTQEVKEDKEVSGDGKTFEKLLHNELVREEVGKNTASELISRIFGRHKVNGDEAEEKNK